MAMDDPKSSKLPMGPYTTRMSVTVEEARLPYVHALVANPELTALTVVVRDLCKRSLWSTTEIAKMLGIPRTTLASRLNRQTPLRLESRGDIEMASKIASLLGFEPTTIIDQARDTENEAQYIWRNTDQQMLWDLPREFFVVPDGSDPATSGRALSNITLQGLRALREKIRLTQGRHDTTLSQSFRPMLDLALDTLEDPEAGEGRKRTARAWIYEIFDRAIR